MFTPFFHKKRPPYLQVFSTHTDREGVFITLYVKSQGIPFPQDSKILFI